MKIILDVSRCTENEREDVFSDIVIALAHKDYANNVIIATEEVKQ